VNLYSTLSRSRLHLESVRYGPCATKGSHSLHTLQGVTAVVRNY